MAAPHLLWASTSWNSATCRPMLYNRWTSRNPMAQKKLKPVPHISPGLVVSHVRNMEAAEGRTYSRDERAVAAAIGILGLFFRPDWIQSRILPRRGFIHPPVTGPHDEFKMQDRIIALAEHLANLQEIDGFSWGLDEIRTDSIETGLGKLIAAGMLRRRNIPFHFVVPSGRIGHDYDAEAIIGATTVAIEMKAKVEGNDPSPEAIAYRLRVARKQLPKQTPNLVFLRVPGAWGESETGQSAIAQGVEREFKSSRTISLVVTHWERWYPSPTIDEPNGAERRDRLMVSVRRGAHVDLTALQEALMGGVPDAEMFPWLSLQDLFPT
jgi:hypothetical protein